MIKSISIGSKPFKTQLEVCNTLFDSNYESLQKGCFIPKALRDVYGDEYHVWFPYFDEASDSEWENTLNQSRTEITERHPDTAEVQRVYAEQSDWKFVTFAKINGEYEFVGVFRILRIVGNTITFERKFTKFP